MDTNLNMELDCVKEFSLELIPERSLFLLIIGSCISIPDRIMYWKLDFVKVKEILVI